MLPYAVQWMCRAAEPAWLLAHLADYTQRLSDTFAGICSNSNQPTSPSSQRFNQDLLLRYASLWICPADWGWRTRTWAAVSAAHPMLRGEGAHWEESADAVIKVLDVEVRRSTAWIGATLLQSRDDVSRCEQKGLSVMSSSETLHRCVPLQVCWLCESSCVCADIVGTFLVLLLTLCLRHFSVCAHETKSFGVSVEPLQQVFPHLLITQLPCCLYFCQNGGVLFELLLRARVQVSVFVRVFVVGFGLRVWIMRAQQCHVSHCVVQFGSIRMCLKQTNKQVKHIWCCWPTSNGSWHGCCHYTDTICWSMKHHHSQRSVASSQQLYISDFLCRTK